MARGSVTETGSAGASAADLSTVIGRHVRQFRRQQGHTLRVLADRSGLSVGFLSQLERGQTSIGLTTLRDLAHSLGHEIVDFFDERVPTEDGDRHSNGAPANVTRSSATASTSLDPPETLDTERFFTLTRGSGEHSSQYISGLRTYRMLSRRAPGLVLEPMLVEIAPGGRIGNPETHHGEEFAYVVSGELTFTVSGTSHRLFPGDSLHLKSEIPHQLHNDTDQVVVVVSVVTPRLF